EFGVGAGHGVVFESALAALGVSAAVADGDGDHHRHAVLCDEVVERDKERAVGAVGADDEGRGGGGVVLFWNVNGDIAVVRRGVAGGDDEFGGFGRVHGAEGVGLARDAGIDLAVGRLHGERVHRPLGHAVLSRHGGVALVRGTDDEVAVGV